MMHTRLRREEVIGHLLQSMKQPVDKKKKSKGPEPTKETKGSAFRLLGRPVPGVRPTLEIKRGKKTIVDWVNGHTKMKTRVTTVENTQNLLRDWWGRSIRFRKRSAEWITHTLREHNKEVDLWATKGAKGRCRRMGGQHSHCVARGYRTLWFWKRSYDCRQICLTSHLHNSFHAYHTAWLKCLYARVIPFSCHP